MCLIKASKHINNTRTPHTHGLCTSSHLIFFLVSGCRCLCTKFIVLWYPIENRWGSFCTRWCPTRSAPGCAHTLICPYPHFSPDSLYLPPSLLLRRQRRKSMTRSRTSSAKRSSADVWQKARLASWQPEPRKINAQIFDIRSVRWALNSFWGYLDDKWVLADGGVTCPFQGTHIKEFFKGKSLPVRKSGQIHFTVLTFSLRLNK